MKIVLLRHGQPEFDLHRHARTRYVPAQLAEIITRYTNTPLDTTVRPSVETIAMARECNAVVCSDLPRSIDSARILGHEAIQLIDPIFRESDLPHADWRFPRLSLYTWFITFRLLWLLGYSNNGESIKQARQRAATASETLTGIAESHDSVLLMGHGFMNRFIANHLRTRGWRGPKDPGKEYWGYGVYHY